MFHQPLERRRLLASIPSGFSDSVFASGLDRPVAIDVAPDGRAFVTEQRGTVRVVRDGALLPTPFVQLDVASGGERGVDGITLDPQFETNHYVYVFHTAKTPYLHNRVSRFTADGDVATPGSETVIFDLDRLDAGSAVHNGGGIHFGPDGKLYVAAGENDSPDKAQSLNTTLGKLLRVNPDGSVPDDNPFFTQTTGNNRAIYALGFRNPFTFDIERNTGRTFVNDVGAAAWEEIDDVSAGDNLGWPREEGPGNNAQLEDPLYAYHHDRGDPDGCAIVGGTFYDPPAGAGAPGAFPAEYAGDYFFADGCNPWVWRLDSETGTASLFSEGISFGFGLTTGPDGSLYNVGYTTGEVRRIAYAEPGAPVILNPPVAQSVAAGRGVTFNAVATGLEPLAFQWQRDGADIPGATDRTYTLDPTTPGDNGAAFRVVVTNPLGSATSAAATLAVVTDAPPAPTILTPKEGSLYSAGSALRFRGAATDPEDGRLPASAFSWRIDFHHDEHFHPFMPETPGKKSGRIRIPTLGEASPDVWYRVHLTVTDSAGVPTTTFRDVHPRTVTITAATTVPGLQLNLDGQPTAAPLTFTAVVGLRRTLEAPATQIVEGQTFAFRGWGRRKKPLLEFKTPKRDQTYAAAYEVVA
jgi:glucose/arabinose dehydrogenase